jgi:hypothetical protein
MKAKLFNLEFEIDKKGTIKGPWIIRETIEIVLNRYSNSPSIGNFYAYALNKTFGKNFKIISTDESTEQKIN